VFSAAGRLRYDDQRRIVMDPDEEVRGAVALVLRCFVSPAVRMVSCTV